MSLLKVENIKIGYGKKTIIDGITFQVTDNEFIGLLGLNGAGKTTLLKSICGLLKPMHGSCLLSGRDLYEYAEKERAKLVSYMPQRHSITYDINVLQVVLMGITPYLGLFHSPVKKHRNMVHEILERMGIEGLANENFHYLSEGQKQIVIIARNLMQDSRIMLFDEPDSALDFNNKHMIISRIKEVVKREKKMGIITLHDPNMALQYCDRIIILKDKKKIGDFYTNQVDIKFLTEVFNEIYYGIEIIRNEDRYLIVR